MSAVSWQEFATAFPMGASAGERLILQHTIVYFATTRRTGWPQLHPVMPYFYDGRLWVFIVDGTSKMADLERDGRYAFHTLPSGEPSNEEVMISGRAIRAPAEPGLRDAVEKVAGFPKFDWEVLFEMQVERCLYATWEHWGTDHPDAQFTRWSAAKGTH